MSAGCDDARVAQVGVADLPVVAALHAACFPEDPWSPQAVADVLAMPGASGWLAYGADGMPAAFLLALSLVPEVEILSIGVAPVARRRGLARRLIELLVELARQRGAREVLLEVAEDNAAARRLYAQAGFEPIGRRPNYYKRGDDAVAALSLRLILGSGRENKASGTA
ncbi:MAG TPA: GNAT family N-acetyltransferase [Stellaceae bacterium]|jgi:ribosomal-protein-alanine N-acetyltransferase